MTQHKETSVADVVKFILKVTIGTFVLVNLVIATEIVINSLFPDIPTDQAGYYIFGVLLWLTIMLVCRNAEQHFVFRKGDDDDTD